MAVKKQAAPEQTKELTVMPRFVAKEAKSYEVEANYEEVETYLKGQRAKYRDVAFSPDNLDEVIRVNGEMVGLRTSLTAVTESVKKIRFNGPKAVFQKKMDSLIAIAGEIEAETKKVLDAKNQERVDELNEVFESYKQHFQMVHSLEDRFLERVEFKQSWYNKTAKEKESKAELEAQFEALKKEQVARNGSIKLIKKALADTPQINEQAQIDKFDSGTDVASILEWIEGEQIRLDDLEKSVEEEAEEESELNDDGTTQDGPPTLMRQVVGIAKKIDFTTDLPGKTKSIVLEITYPYDAGDAMTELFKQLREYGITTKAVKAGS